MQTGELKNVIDELLGIQFNIEKARLDGKAQNLAIYINEKTLVASHKEMDRRKAKGIDDVSKDDYSANLKANIEHLVKRMRNGSYKPQLIRRVYIPKDGSNKMRPLGISCYEDKLIESIIAQILIEVYEPKFFNESYGFRPNRNCHQAVREIIEDIQYHKVSYIVEADIKSFFDNVDHEWLIKFLEHDIADKKFIEAIKKFLKAGIMENGKYLDSERGTPQGNGASPVLANIYLHYVLDYWFAIRIKRQCKGEAYLIRYCDDFVCCFQNKWEAKKFYVKLIERFKKFGLELALEKTKILEFGRFAKRNRANRGLAKPETFDFLGFTFYCSEDGKTMNEYEFEQFLHKQIPITEQMGISVIEFSPSRVRMSAKLEPNLNHKGTAFGGSINCLMTVCGWALVYANIKAIDEDAHIVIQKSNINYLVPINTDFTAECTLFDEESRKCFFEMYDKHNKGRLKLKVTCTDKKILLAEYQGQYVAFK